MADSKELHPRALELLFEMQGERMACINCNRETKTDVHVEYRTGIAVFTKYVCPFCKYEFLERDIPRESKDSGDNA